MTSSTGKRPRDRTALLTRVARAALSAPDAVVDRVIGAPPVVMDGRTLNRTIQAMIAIGDRVGLTGPVADVETRRKQLARLSAIGMPRRLGIHVTNRVIPGPESELAVRIYRRFGSAPEPPAIVYYHGGGWVVGDLDSHEGSCRLLADVTGCVVVSVDYRLAPEHPFPAAVHDAVAAYRWVQGHTGELSIAQGQVGVMGDSAGGNLAAVVAQVTRDGDVPPPIAQALIYPATDVLLRSRSHQMFATGFFLTREDIEWFRGHYLPDPTDWDSPLASPGEQHDLSGLAPALVVTAGFDPLRDEAMDYAAAMASAGVPVTARCYDDMVHGFFGMGVLPDGPAMADEICAGVGELMHRG